MTDLGIIEWEGTSGKKYKYWIYKIDTTFEAVAGNYVFARNIDQKYWQPVYIGQTSDLSERFDDHHKMPCIKQEEATHIHVHKSSDNEAERLAEESDLVKKWNPICND